MTIMMPITVMMAMTIPMMTMTMVMTKVLVSITRAGLGSGLDSRFLTTCHASQLVFNGEEEDGDGDGDGEKEDGDGVVTLLVC